MTIKNITMDADLKKLGGLATVLLGLMIIVGVVFLVGAKWKDNICTSELSTHAYVDGVCQVSSTNTTAVTVAALTQVGIVESALITALGFLGILVLVGIAKILVRMTKSF